MLNQGSSSRRFLVRHPSVVGEVEVVVLVRAFELLRFISGPLPSKGSASLAATQRAPKYSTPPRRMLPIRKGHPAPSRIVLKSPNANALPKKMYPVALTRLTIEPNQST